MDVINEDGDLFGTINVVDALVVLVLMAVVISGVAIVAGAFSVIAAFAVLLLLTAIVGGFTTIGAQDSTQLERRYATIELESQPDYVLERIDEGNVGTLDGTDETVTVTDVQIIPARGGADDDRPDVTLRTEVTGKPIPDDAHGRDRFQVTGTNFQLGNEIRLDMGPYTVTGMITDLEREGATLSEGGATTTAHVDLKNVSPIVANTLEAGMTETTRGETVARLESIERKPARLILESEDGELHEREHPRNVNLTLVVELQTTVGETGMRFRGQRLRVDSSIVLDFGSITVDGTITAIR
ncbi:DUF4330 family protein [Natronorubrum sp. DTA28]|uniref:DUF4330 family protein n=1 Tax=Natronorubrum sp. DTA28 TaxID=3447019 RepID=UPI003F8705F6